MNRSNGLAHHNLAQVVIDPHHDNDAIDNNSITLPQECNSCNSLSTIPHAIQITR